MLYGDTDSVFLDKCALQENEVKVNMLIEEMQSKFKGIELSKDTSWNILAFSKNAKQYFGLTCDNELKIVGMGGLKSNEPRYFETSVKKIIENA